jgi:hypothetical protein
VRIEFTYTRGPDHYAGHPAVPGKHPSATPSYVIAAVIFLAGATLTVAALVSGTGQAVSCGALGVLLGASIAVAARQRRKARFVMPPSAMEPRQWVVSDEGVEISHSAASVTVAWPAFRYVLELPRAYLFVMRDPGDKRTVDIPRQYLTPSEDEALREVFARHGIAFYSRPMVG